MLRWMRWLFQDADISDPPGDWILNGVSAHALYTLYIPIIFLLFMDCGLAHIGHHSTLLLHAWLSQQCFSSTFEYQRINQPCVTRLESNWKRIFEIGLWGRRERIDKQKMLVDSYSYIKYLCVRCANFHDLKNTFLGLSFLNNEYHPISHTEPLSMWSVRICFKDMDFASRKTIDFFTFSLKRKLDNH